MGTPREHKRLLDQALAREGEAHRLLLAGRDEEGREALVEVARLYRASWEEAPPSAYGRLIGYLKAAILAGIGGEEAAGYVSDAIPEAETNTPVARYALALAALAGGDDQRARRMAAGMGDASDAFARTAEAIDALASGDGERYAAALGAIVADFEARSDHLTGVAIADTALVLEALAEVRGLADRPSSPVIP